MTNEEAIEELNAHLIHWKRLLREKICSQEDGKKTINALNMAIKALEQESKIGHWKMKHYIDKNRQGFNMWMCSECYNEYSYDAETGVGITDAHYCPNCGAKMVEQQESEDKE